MVSLAQSHFPAKPPQPPPTNTYSLHYRLPPLVGILAVGYGITTFREAQMEKRVAAMEQAEAERQRRANMLADAYGDRGSLEDMERAVRAYEAQQRQ